jgi:DNA-binding NarL/FixJ family response regulator
MTLTQSKDITLFVVEDDDVDFMAISRSFKKMRIANPVVRAKNGEEALTLLQQEKVQYPYIILLDLRMPKLSGIDLLKAIRKDKLLCCATVFVLTSSDNERDIIETHKLNVAGYFVKELAGKEFIDVVALLEGYWRIAQLPEESS